ncbi:hypothetical protein Thiowin_03560 [Thiorhodovibrio winogradskyi]|uniref:Uncharacterized protein n=1 Tax=Thiorhodovibrio winogradskyi TaxID=77007 RepID=A0ABZ0SDF4_9GAMM
MRDELNARLSGNARGGSALRNSTRGNGDRSEPQHQVQRLKLGPMQNLVYVIKIHVMAEEADFWQRATGASHG